MRRYFFFCIELIFLISCSQFPDSTEAGRMVQIVPVYIDLEVPCNIAPLNFSIIENGESFLVSLYGKKGKAINIKKTKGIIEIPRKVWKRLLSENKNDSLFIDIYCKENSGKWIHYNTIRHFISPDIIDPYIVYRNIGPANILWTEMSIEQRCIENNSIFKIADNKLTDRNCINCHAFNQNDPEQMMFHMRAQRGGTVVKQNDHLLLLNTGTDKTISAGVYPAWHPSGKFIAFSTNKIHQRFFFKTEKYEIVEDEVSDIILLDLKKNSISTCRALSTQMRENIPTWSPDGKYLYYILGNPYDSMDYKSNKYDLMRIAFDESTIKWGTPDTILLASKFGKSVSFPDISPDGKWLLFCMSDYGYFTVYNPESDIYIMNLETREYKKLPCNSDYVESYPTWSSNGKWIMFVSKRKDNIFSRPWFCHFNNGKISEPFVLPQKDPHFYNSYLKNFNRPEFVKNKVNLSPIEVYRLSKQVPLKSEIDTSMLDGLSGATSVNKNDSSLYLK